MASTSPQERRLLGLLIRGLVPVVRGTREMASVVFPHEPSPPSISIRVAALFNLLFIPHVPALPLSTVAPPLAARIANQLQCLVRSLHTTSDIVDTIVDAVHQRLPVSRSLVQKVQTDSELLEACTRSCWYRVGWVPPAITDALVQQIDLVVQMLEHGVLLPPLITAAAREPWAAARVLCAGITTSDLIMSAKRDARMAAITVQHRPDLDAVMRMLAPHHDM